MLFASTAYQCDFVRDWDRRHPDSPDEVRRGAESRGFAIIPRDAKRLCAAPHALWGGRFVFMPSSTMVRNSVLRCIPSFRAVLVRLSSLSRSATDMNVLLNSTTAP